MRLSYRIKNTLTIFLVDDESGWNMGGYSSGSSDTSDGEYTFNGHVSDASDDSSIADGEWLLLRIPSINGV